MFIADAKTGKSASVEHAATRRQLLEYREAFAVDGVLLVGPAGVQRVELGVRETKRAQRASVAIAVALLALLAWALAEHQKHQRNDETHQQANDARVSDDVLGLETHDAEQR